MRPVVRTWPALSALGAGLVHLGVAAAAPTSAAVVLAVLGSAELAWAVASLVIGSAPLPKLFLAVSLAPALFAAGVLALSMSGGHQMSSESMDHMSASGMPGSTAGPFFAACGLDLVMALGCAWAIRRSARASQQAGGGSARAIAGLMLGAALVSGAVVPALGMTEVGHDAGVHMHM